MQDQQYERTKHIIRNMDGDIVFTGVLKVGEIEVPSINAAKRESRRLQSGALGYGSLRVAP